MKKKVDLLQGHIFSSITKLALPIMATSLIQMAYNLIDMLWIGRLGSDSVAAVGAAGMYMWLSTGLVTVAKMGGQVKVGQMIGADSKEEAKEYVKTTIQLGIMLGLIFGVISILFSSSLIKFFNLNTASVREDATKYLMVTCGLVIFSFLNQIFTGLFTAMGNSRIPFIATSMGLVINIVLDPILIFGLGPIPQLGVLGAGIATVVAQSIVTIMFLILKRNGYSLFHNLKLYSKLNICRIKDIAKIGLPVGAQSMLFTGISMIIARMIADFSDACVAVQKVGSQIESISWMTAEGFAAAVNSFVAQNYGAKNISRVKKGYYSAMIIVLSWGIFCTMLLFFFPAPIFRVFIPEATVLPLGIDYLKIISISEVFMCIELTTAGAFNGLGKTIHPSIISVILTALRIPLAKILIQTPLGINGIWWSFSISSVLKGIVMVSWYLIIQKQLEKRDACETAVSNQRT